MNEIMENIKRGTSDIISLKELENKLVSGKKLRIKWGIDPTAPDLHLGHSVILDKLKVFQYYGHHVIILVGDFTAKIGDPSGRTKTRHLLTDGEIESNMKTYAEQVFKILDRDKTEIAYNSKWFNEIGIDGLLQLASKSTVAQMLVRDDFAKRYKEDKPISIIEFLYPLLQAYDSVALNADIEFGATDQKFNLLLGREIQRDYGQDPQIVITMSLLEGKDGIRKMSKSYNNYIALNDSPGEMFGKIMSISDELMYKYYELLTRTDLNEVKALHPKEAKNLLAQKIVAKYHGADEAVKAAKEFDKVFAKKGVPDDINIGEYIMQEAEMKLSDLLVRSGMVSSKNAARRLLIEQKSVSVDSQRVNRDYSISSEKPFIVKVGKRRFKRIIPANIKVKNGP